MAFTQTDLENIQQAILSLAMGTRVVRVRIKNRELEYSEVDISKLEALEKKIQADLTGGPSLLRVTTSKGL